MTEPKQPGVEIEPLLQRIREEAARRQRETAPAETEPPPRQWLYSLGELLRHDDVEFVTHLYRCVLQREPDPEGLRDHLSRLRNGECGQLAVLRGLRFSPEGERVGVEVRGLLPPAAPWTLIPPVLDPPAERGAALEGTPSHPDFPPLEGKEAITLPELLELADEAFVVRAYRALLRREPDIAGGHHHLAQLRTGQSTKIEVLGQLRYSREGRQAGVEVRGLWWPYVLQTAYRLPVIGAGLALAALIVRPRRLIARLRKLEAEAERNRAREAAAERWTTELTRLQQLVAQQVNTTELAQVKQGVRDLAEQVERGIGNLTTELTQIQWLADAKANGGEWLELQRSVQGLERDKANASELAALRETLATKAEADHLTQVWQALVTLREALATKAEAEHLTQVWQALAGKAEAEHLTQAWQALAGKAEAEHLMQVWQALATKAEATAAQAELQALQNRIDGELPPLRQQLSDYRRTLLDQQRRLGLLLDEARRRLPAPLDAQQLATFAAEQDHRLDALYVSFEDQFRGTRAEIQQRLQVYLPYLRQAGIGADDRPILDLGCGRGEWVELLWREGFAARGIDLNRVMVAECRERGLWVDEAEALACLRALPDASLGAVTGLHIIEHLPLTVLMDLLDEALRVVRPGGLAIFETPNPENLMVSAYNFYFDPTHRNPLPPRLSSFLLEGRGWTSVEILRLNPYPDHQRFSVAEGPSQITSWLNEVFCGPQDYAVIGRKP